MFVYQVLIFFFIKKIGLITRADPGFLEMGGGGSILLKGWGFASLIFSHFS